MVSSTIVLVHYNNVGLSEYRTGEFEKLSDIGQRTQYIELMDIGLKKTNGCPALLCPETVIISYMPYRNASL